MAHTIISRFPFENNYTDLVGSNTLTAQGAGNSFVTSGPIPKRGGYSLALTGAGWAKKVTQSGLGSGNIDLSYGGWFYPVTAASTASLGGIGVSSANVDQNIWALKTSATNIRVDLGSDFVNFTVPAIGNATWNWLWITYASASKSSTLYLNNVISSSGTQAHTGNLNLAVTTNLLVGADIDGNNAIIGNMDDWIYASGISTTTQMNQLYQNATAGAAMLAAIL